MVNVYEIDLRQIIPKLQKGKEYNIYTLYRDVPVNVKTKLLWIDMSQANIIYIAFDWKNVSMKYAFQTGNPVYIKISIPYEKRELSFYIKCNIFSNLRDELVLIPEIIIEVPPFLNRSSVRVEIDFKTETFAKMCQEELNECFEDLSVKNISENGFAIRITKDEDGKYLDMFNELKDLINKNMIFDVELNINKDIIRGVANLVNIYDEPNEVIAGFKFNPDKRDLQKLRAFIIKRQQEIIQEIKAL